jgi:hypothetical protein
LPTWEGKKVWQEAFYSLREQKILVPYQWSDELALAAQDHCADSGISGTSSHLGSSGSMPYNRITRYGRNSGKFSESIILGNGNGRELIMQLFIDDGVKRRNNRKNIQNEDMRMTGVAYCEHREKGGMLVVVYAENFSPSKVAKSAVKKREAARLALYQKSSENIYEVENVSRKMIGMGTIEEEAFKV